jgi:hypothetical protein
VGGVWASDERRCYSWRRYPCNSEHYHDGSVVDEVVVVPLIGLLTGDAAAWAGTNTVSTIGFIHLDGMRMVTVRPPTANISRARRRVVLLSVIETFPFAPQPNVDLDRRAWRRSTTQQSPGTRARYDVSDRRARAIRPILPAADSAALAK